MTYTRLHNLTLTICLGTCLLTSAWSASVFAQRAGSTSNLSSTGGTVRQPVILPEEAVPDVSGPQSAETTEAPEELIENRYSQPPSITSSPSWQSEPVFDEPLMQEAPAFPWSSGDWFRNGQYHVEADYLIVNRSRLKGGRYPLGFDNTTGALMTTEGRPFTAESGVRATIGRQLYRDYQNRDHSIEFTFMGISEFEMQDSIQARFTNGIVAPLNTALQGFNGADLQIASHDSRMTDYQINYRIHRRLSRDRLVMAPDGSWSRQYTQGHSNSLIIGLRYVSIDENFVWQSQRFNTNPNTFSGALTSATENDLLGITIGGELLDQYETWNWGLRGKGTLGINFADTDTEIFVNNSQVYSVTPSSEDFGFVAEFGMFAAYHLSPNCSLRLSYDLMWYGGLAGAAGQTNLNFNPIQSAYTNSVIFLQVVGIGAQYTW